MAAAAVEPVPDAVLGLGDGRAHGPLGSGAVGVRGCAGNVAFLLEAFEKLPIGAANVPTKDVAAGGFVLAEIAGGADRECSSRPVRLLGSGRAGAIGGTGRLAGAEPAQGHSKNGQNQ